MGILSQMSSCLMKQETRFIMMDLSFTNLMIVLHTSLERSVLLVLWTRMWNDVLRTCRRSLAWIRSKKKNSLLIKNDIEWIVRLKLISHLGFNRNLRCLGTEVQVFCWIQWKEGVLLLNLHEKEVSTTRKRKSILRLHFCRTKVSKVRRSVILRIAWEHSTTQSECRYWVEKYREINDQTVYYGLLHS